MASESTPGLLAVERRQQLLDILALDGKIDIASASRLLNASSETIRKDLIALHEERQLRRVHGGALPLQTMAFERRVEQRTDHYEEKRRIAEEALNELPPEGAIFLDSGSTTRILAEMLPGDLELTCFTNSIAVAQVLFSQPSITCYLLGGRTRGVSGATVGTWALETLSNLMVDVLFAGTNAISFDRGLATPDGDEADIKQAMLMHAKRRILLADHSKFGQDAMFRYAGFDDLDLIITGKELPGEKRSILEERGIEVEYS